MSDLIEVIRCRDCVWQGTADCVIADGRYRHNDGFCSYGLRKIKQCANQECFIWNEKSCYRDLCKEYFNLDQLREEVGNKR